MDNFNLKKYLAKNPLLTEGQFSWMTQDTDQQIGSERENTIDVYMVDDKGNVYFEPKYQGYGEFGGKDYYELLDQMNGGTGDRGRGIDLAFGQIKKEDGSEVLYPALVTDPKYVSPNSWDFTSKPENDPNQSWYMEPEDDYEDDYDDYDDEDEDDEW